MNLISEYSALINAELARYINVPDNALKGLYQPIEYTLNAGGKRLRPVLTLITATGSKASVADALPAALAIEVFHNFTLVHDDVMDSSPTRRGRPTVQARWGLDTAILSGDTMLSLCYKTLSQLPANVLPQALKLFNDTSIEVYEGQQLDMDFEQQQEVLPADYINMIRLKTSVLLGCAAAMGAIVAQASQTTIAALYDYGVNLGLAFQIQDDLLDIYGDPKTFGKPIGGDILNGKKTFPMILAMQSEKAQKLKAAMATPADEHRIKSVTEIYNSINVKETCRAEISKYTSLAIASLDKCTEMQADSLDTLKSLANSLIAREK